MQITNASRELSNKIGTNFYFLNCLINEDRKVKFGSAPESSTANWGVLSLLVSMGVGIYFFSGLGYSWWAYIVLFFSSVILAAYITGLGTIPEDTRKEYIVSKIGVIQRDRVSTKSTGKSLVGAGVGGVLFGGAGAVVGAVSAGNLVSEFIDIAVKFTDNNWIVLSAESKEEGLRILSLLGSHADQECPI